MNKLFIIPTPVGNLEDMTFRAIKILKEVDFILAEDTRTSGILLKHFDIQTKMFSHHKFNEHQTVGFVADKILQGESCALISDAGTPSISDPGFLLVKTCIEKNIEIECLPGATAFVPALVNSGFPSDRFCFEGFLPQKKGKNKKVESLVNEERTMIFYESPFRLVKTLELFEEYFGHDRKVSVSREISKIYNETVRGTINEVINHFTTTPPKGEIVVVVTGKNNNNFLK
ncbi:MAG: 16S rRNA (cytidine(1402)-2'-O)-methyltransferase [Bacteroidales bacterium]|nr:16S rRNA (cytidine(1402)-2'-O)-methyltransferase [Bacteroidales bacterium]